MQKRNILFYISSFLFLHHSSFSLSHIFYLLYCRSNLFAFALSENRAILREKIKDFLNLIKLIFANFDFRMTATPQSALLLQKQLKGLQFSLIKIQLNFFKNIFSELNKNPVNGFSAGLIDDNDIYKWEVLIIGPPDTLQLVYVLIQH